MYRYCAQIVFAVVAVSSYLVNFLVYLCPSHRYCYSFECYHGANSVETLERSLRAHSANGKEIYVFYFFYEEYQQGQTGKEWEAFEKLLEYREKQG